jgi:hypothetical protein
MIKEKGALDAGFGLVKVTAYGLILTSPIKKGSREKKARARILSPTSE